MTSALGEAEAKISKKYFRAKNLVRQTSKICIYEVLEVILR